jgi:hypothetical protein
VKDRIRNLLKESDSALTFNEIVEGLGYKTSNKKITYRAEKAVDQLVVVEQSLGRIKVSDLAERLGLLKINFHSPATRLFFIKWNEEVQIANWAKRNLSQEEVVSDS